MYSHCVQSCIFYCTYNNTYLKTYCTISYYPYNLYIFNHIYTIDFLCIFHMPASSKSEKPCFWAMKINGRNSVQALSLSIGHFWCAKHRGLSWKIVTLNQWCYLGASHSENHVQGYIKSSWWTGSASRTCLNAHLQEWLRKWVSNKTA